MEPRTRTASPEPESERFRVSQRATLDSLPPEVLSMVFLATPGSLPYYMLLLGFRRVCKYWMEVIDSTPELWTIISSRFHPKLQTMIIQKCRNELLDVEYEEGSVWIESLDPGTENKMEVFASLVEPLMPRWQSLRYHRTLSGRDSRILSRPLHNLQRIRIDGPAQGWSYQPPILDAPKLSEVQVSNSSLNWNSLSGLQVLSLYSTNPTLETLIAILRASPGLRSLSLEKVSLDVRPSWNPRSTNKLFLPQLHTLRIERVPTQSAPFLLDQIEAPSLDRVQVEISEGNSFLNYTNLCESAGRHVGAFPLPEGRKRSHLLIEASDWETSLGVGEQRILVGRSAWTRNLVPRAKVAYIASAMKRMDDRVREEMKVLDLDCSITEDIGEYLRIVHSHFPRIDQIRVEDKQEDRADVDLVLQRLSSPSHLGSSEEWLLPKLTKLQLDLQRSRARNFGDRILELLRNRKATEGIEEITELRIVVKKRAIDRSTVELLRQSLVLFRLDEN